MIEADHAPVRPATAALAPEYNGVRSTWLPLLGWAGFSLLVLYAILLGGGWIGIYSVYIRALSLGIVTVGLVAWLVTAVRRPQLRPTTAIWPAFALPLLAFVLSTAFSPLPRLGIDYLAWAVLLTALYLLLVRILALPFARARIGGLAAILALVLGAAYIAMALMRWIEWWGLVGDIRVPPLRPGYLSMPWGGPSAVLTVQVLLAAAAAAGLGLRTRAARASVVTIVVLTGLVAVISGSRSGWLALAASLAIMAGLWLLSTSDRASILRVVRSRRVQAAVMVVGVVAVLAAIVVGPAVLARFQEGGDGGRPVYWATALRMFADAPLLGLGPGNWTARRIAYTEAGELDFYIPHAHNQSFETAAEFGIVGLAAALVVLACLAWLALSALRGADPTRRRWAWAMVFGLLYLAVATVVDSYTFPAILLPLALPIAYLDATSTGGIGPFSRWRLSGSRLRGAATVLLLVGCLASALVLARSEAVALTHAQAAGAVVEADWEAALPPAMDAAAADPQLAPYQLTVGLAAAGAGAWETAEAAFRAAAALDDLPESWLGLALAQAELGRPVEEVDGSLQRALRLGVQHPAIIFAAGQVYERIGMEEAASAAFVKTVAALPSLAADERWAEQLGTTDRFPSIIDRAIDTAPGVGWEIALMAGDVGRAQSLASARAGSGFASLVIDAWSGDPAALDTIRALAARDPMDANVLAWAARLSDRAGDAEVASRYRRLVDLGARGAAQGVEVRVGQRESRRDAALGTGTYYYGIYLYRRMMPPDLIVPGPPGLVIEDLSPPETAP